jgi:hypothetical protein
LLFTFGAVFLFFAGASLGAGFAAAFATGFPTGFAVFKEAPLLGFGGTGFAASLTTVGVLGALEITFAGAFPFTFAGDFVVSFAFSLSEDIGW